MLVLLNLAPGQVQLPREQECWDLWDNRRGAKRIFQIMVSFSLLICKQPRLSPTTQPPLCTHRPDSQIKKLVW